MTDDNDLAHLLSEEEAANELREATEEVARRLETEKYKYYEPNGKAEEFIRNVGNAKDLTIVLFSAANGVGKTAVAANTVAHILYGSDGDIDVETGERTKWFDYPLFNPDKWPFPKRGRIATDPTNINLNVIPALKEWLPAGRYETKKGGKQFDSLWKTDTGFEFDVMTYEQDPKEFEGATLGWAWFDEPPTFAIFKATVTRMRKGGVIFITETPVDDGAAWIYDKLIAGDKELDVDGEKVKRNVFYTEAAMEDACKEHGIRGHLEHQQIMLMAAEYSEDEREARIYGRFQHFTGRVFKNFSRNIHVVKPFNINIRDYAVWEFLDPHPRTPDAVLWIAVDRQGTHWVVDELNIKPQQGSAELAAAIKNKASQFRIIQRYADPSAFIADQHQEDGKQPKSLADKLKDHDLHYLAAPKFRSQADQAIIDAFSYQKVPGSDEFIIKPKVYIFEHCRTTIWQVENYRWDNWTGKTAEKKDPKATPLDKDDHQVENLGRGLILKLQFQPYVIYREHTEEEHFDPYANPII